MLGDVYEVYESRFSWLCRFLLRGRMRQMLTHPDHDSLPHFRDGKTEHLARIIRDEFGAGLRRILVVGCGAGLEAAILAQELGAQVVGVDPVTSFDPAVLHFVDLRQGDATALEFEDGSFDLVYSFHALEHIPRYRHALGEMRRVTAATGGCCIGTPNRERLVGYLGSKEATRAEKFRWNLIDWRARLSGRFTNEEGAHAGFTAADLHTELARHFHVVNNISARYYREIYSAHTGTINLLARAGVSRFVFPAVYFLGRA